MGLKLEVGKTYRNGRGSHRLFGGWHGPYYYGIEGFMDGSDGEISTRDKQDNLIEEVPEETTEKASKHDSGKNMLGLIPVEGLLQVGKVMTYGAKKYGAFNYTKGHESVQLISACLRHLLEGYMSGENIDKESGEPHLAHAAANLLMLIQQTKDGTIVDNRPKPVK